MNVVHPIIFFYLLLSFIGFETIANAQNINKFKEQATIKENNVKSITLYSYKYIRDTLSKERVKTWTAFYDKEGNNKLKYQYINNGKDSTSVNCSFDKEQIKTTCIHYNEEGKKMLTLEMQYDKEGNKLKAKYFSQEDKLIKYREYKVDMKKKEVVGWSYQPGGKPDRKRIDRIDDNGNIVTMRYYDKENPKKIWSTIVLTYNSVGLVTEETVYFGNDPMWLRKYEYDYFD